MCPSGNNDLIAMGATEVYVLLSVVWLGYVAYTFFYRKGLFSQGSEEDPTGEVWAFIMSIVMGSLVNVLIAMFWPVVLAIVTFVAACYGFYRIREKYNKVEEKAYEDPAGPD